MFCQLNCKEKIWKSKKCLLKENAFDEITRKKYTVIIWVDLKNPYYSLLCHVYMLIVMQVKAYMFQSAFENYDFQHFIRDTNIISC